MSQKTIECRLIATEATRRYLWHLMTEKYTPLINALLKQVAQDDHFEEWCQTGTISVKIVKQFCDELKKGSQFAGQPGRFYSSAIALVHRIYKSWLALRKRLRYKIAGQTRWLAMLKSDDELTEASGSDLDILKAQAEAILAQIQSQALPGSNSKPRKARNKKKPTQAPEQKKNSIPNELFQLYDAVDNVLTRCAIAYLLKNGCKLPDKPEDAKKFAKRRRKTEIRLERLMHTLQRTRLPQGRDLSWKNWLQALEQSAKCVPQDEDQAAGWQASLLTEAARLPFPVNYETNEDLRWFLNEKGRLCVSFNGLGEHTFEIYCDQRQLHWFKRFLEDQQAKKASQNKLSSSLFTLRAGRLAWQESKNQGNPWNVHRLSLSCSVETRLWTSEGTDQVRQEKATTYAKVIAGTKAKGDLNEKQEAFIQKREKTLALLNHAYPRPSRPLYQGQPSLLAGVSYGLDKPATLAIVNIQTGKAIIYRSIRQILGENYRLLNRYRLRQQRNAHQRHNNQRKNASNRLRESNQGEHIDRLIAGSIVAIAQQYDVSSIVLPNIGDIREIIQSEVQARAEQAILGPLERQRQYARRYRINVHRWSYAQLSQAIQSQAAQIGIAIEIAKQPFVGTPQEKAKGLAIAAYQARK
ncbi:MAG: type V CRISPR-associated protein Cas12k [Leptolyngbya sp. BL-A-14]